MVKKEKKEEEIKDVQVEEVKSEKEKKEKAPKKVVEVKDEIVQALQVVPEITEAIQTPHDFKTKLTRQQVDIIKSQIAKGASDDELKMFLYVCERTGLDPFTKQVHLVPRWDGKLGKEVRSVIVGIDGLRAVAEKTGAYAGNSDPIMEGLKKINFKEGAKGSEVMKELSVPIKASVTVKKIVQGMVCDFTATAKWDEYYPGDRQGMMWRKMPDSQLGKCAEAKALRKAFPNIMTGLYVAEEMQQAGTGVMTDEQRQIQMFEKAKESLEKVKDKAKLLEYRAGFKASDKYTDGQKAELIEIIDKKTL